MAHLVKGHYEVVGCAAVVCSTVLRRPGLEYIENVSQDDVPLVFHAFIVPVGSMVLRRFFLKRRLCKEESLSILREIYLLCVYLFCNAVLCGGHWFTLISGLARLINSSSNIGGKIMKRLIFCSFFLLPEKQEL